jgi:two-component system, chemotaxis family, CheB/CheR fusion protein
LINPAEITGFDHLLRYLKQNRGFDFSGYKHISLVRRILKRVQAVGLDSFETYTDYLEVHPEEFVRLFNAILINVTGFFRDEQAWAYVDQNVIPRIMAGKPPYAPVRVWSAGCASGEEAYTITMLLAEHLGSDGFRERVKVYATDLDEKSLAKARLAVYSKQDVESVPPELVAKYFDRLDDRFVFSKELRRSVIFGQHNLMQDAPISRIDLLICRNTLMYFHSEAQTKILARLHYALSDQGFLFLGKAEMLLTHTDLFSADNLQDRIFTKIPRSSARERIANGTSRHRKEDDEELVNQLHIAAFERGIVAQMVIDKHGRLVLANEKGRVLFNIGLKDLGRPFQDYELSYRPVELRSVITSVLQHNEPVRINDVVMTLPNEGLLYLNVLVTPLSTRGTEPLGVIVSFMDMSGYRDTQLRLEQTNQALETTSEELQSTNEELETTNEELQSTIEELETTNEELQSTNEELETMNEELQSTNEELETMNDEMNQRSNDLNKLNDFLEAIMACMRGGVIVADADLNVQLWNRKSEDLWGLRSDEVKGQNLFGIDIGLPVDQLKKPIRSILNQETEAVEINLVATNRRGRNIACDVFCSPLRNSQMEVKGVVLVVEQKEMIAE